MEKKEKRPAVAGMERFVISSSAYKLTRFKRYLDLFTMMGDSMRLDDGVVDITMAFVNNVELRLEISQNLIKRYLWEMRKIGLIHKIGKSNAYVLHPQILYKGRIKNIPSIKAQYNFLNVDSVIKNYDKFVTHQKELRNKSRLKNKIRTGVIKQMNS
jgi:hypothetical protein